MLSGLNVASFSQARYRFGVGAILILITYTLLLNAVPSRFSPWQKSKPFDSQEKEVALERTIRSIADTSKMYIANPLSPSQFGEMGKRVEVMRDWIATKSSIESQMDLDQIKDTSSCIEEAVVAAFPFIHNPTGPLAQESLENLRKRYVPNSKGIVIPTGKGTFRFACHLVSSLRDVLSSELPIQIVYAGDEDLPEDYRYLITRLGSRIEALDITKVLDDKTLQLAKGGWAIKAFAALASTFEQVLVLDADAVFIQKPEVILNNHKGYKETGSLLFHDRLLWQGAFKERHEWWEKEMKGHVASGTLNKSKVYNDRYAEEGDSGVVALDKSRLPIFMGLLHICWQNTLAVREAWTYRMGYGDKESWWFGLELSGANYTFEDHYGSIVGDERTVGTSKKVCSFTIAHLDREDKLLWYNGSLLKNKAINKLEFEVPSHWMVDGVWEKGATKPDISCMRDGVVRNMTNEEKEILTASVKVAKQVDQKIKHLVDL